MLYLYLCEAQHSQRFLRQFNFFLLVTCDERGTYDVSSGNQYGGRPSLDSQNGRGNLFLYFIVYERNASVSPAAANPRRICLGPGRPSDIDRSVYDRQLSGFVVK